MEWRLDAAGAERVCSRSRSILDAPVSFASGRAACSTDKLVAARSP